MAMRQDSPVLPRLLVILPSLFLIPLALLACGGEESGQLSPADTVPHSVTVTPSSVILRATSATRQFSAEARSEAGDVVSGVSFSWSSSDAAVATVDADGTATAQGEGHAHIIATAQGVADSASLTVDTSTSGGGSGNFVIPDASDWSAQGTVVAPGGSGAWDRRFPHGTPGPVLEKNGTYYMYYIGADGDRPSDGGPAHRAVGVATATSPAGPWSKHSSNPVIPWSDLENNGDDEEGAWRLAGLVDDDGTIVLYVSDLVGSGGSVNGDIRLFTSPDGVNFTDQGIVIAHDDATFPGNDELGPLGAWKGDDGTYYLWYTRGADGSGWTLALASGPDRDSFTSGQNISSAEQFGHGTDPIAISDSELAMFWGDQGGDFFAYTQPRSDPTSLSAKQATYSGQSNDQFAVFLDRDTSTWYGFFTTGSQGDSDSIELFSAPALP